MTSCSITSDPSKRGVQPDEYAQHHSQCKDKEYERQQRCFYEKIERAVESAVAVLAVAAGRTKVKLLRHKD